VQSVMTKEYIDLVLFCFGIMWYRSTICVHCTWNNTVL